MASHADREQMLSEQRFPKAAHRVGSSPRWAAGKNVQPCIISGPGMCLSTERREPNFGTFSLKPQIACQIVLPSMFQLYRIAILYLSLLVRRTSCFKLSAQFLLRQSPPCSMRFTQIMHNCMASTKCICA